MPPNSNQTGSTQTKEKNEYGKDPEGNEITWWGKIIAGFFLILLTLSGCIAIIRYWPDKLPSPEDKIAPLYINEPFHVRLACLRDTCCPECIDASKKTIDTPRAIITKNIASIDTNAKKDTSTNKDTSKKIASTEPAVASDKSINDDILNYKRKRLLHINTLLLILVALGGFVGNMIHIATSFTTFIGAGKFKRSWLIWYCVKPFTASALAIGIYFVFRGGFLNMSDGGASINLYGLMTISLFAGLFTDKATEKLKEVFDVLFRSKEERPDPLVSKFKISGISPLIIERGKVNKMTITGEKLDTEKLFVSINDKAITDVKILSGTITFDYSIPDELKDEKTLTVSVKDEKDKEYYNAVLTIKNDEPNNEVFPTDVNPPPSVDYHDETNISTNPPKEPPPNIQ